MRTNRTPSPLARPGSGVDVTLAGPGPVPLPRAIFSAFGPVKMVDMSHDPATGGHKGFCFIEYAEVRMTLFPTGPS